ncbi:hypothetical protein SAMN05421823_11915 [Catalinimonas alkaloidigena]|uniref:Uncharacterized protein n=1 Tax=Catalinimonas alkaloidigena TaxID=1075417 RepID=A0A1G9V4M0_9BACT|nr:DUF6166 domain-containing protein [Catalinimonas alkaloidigena]SDM67118.1 hypothetical protein SAMN05421823_11915 [Catalinimonas alkaloidigena]
MEQPFERQAHVVCKIHSNGDHEYWVDGTLLDLGDSLRHVHHSPTGFRHGYGGSGPGQLAFAICLALYQDVVVAKTVYMKFKWTYVQYWPIDEGFDHLVQVPVDPVRLWNLTDDYQHRLEFAQWQEEQRVLLAEEAEEESRRWPEGLDPSLLLSKPVEERPLSKRDQLMLALAPYFVDFEFSLPSRPAKGLCRLLVVPELALVICSEHPQNPSMSVTNAAEYLFLQITEAYNLDRDEVTWIEHYAFENERVAPEFDFVEFHQLGGGAYRPDWHNPTDELIPLLEKALYHKKGLVA